jgi:hypothetical protein
MSDRTYKEMTCAKCDRVIPAGTAMELVAWTPTRSGKKAPNHVECLSPPKPSAPPAVQFPRQEGPNPGSIGGSSPAPGAASFDAPIYTYHRRLNILHQGSVAGWVEHGVSTRGRTILAIEEQAVDDAIRRLANKNERGEVYK